MRWQPGDRLAMTLTPSAVVLCPAPGGLLRVPPRPCIAIPVTARRLLSITPGDELLLAAAPEYRIVITHTMQAVEDMLASFYAQIAADELPQPPDRRRWCQCGPVRCGAAKACADGALSAAGGACPR